MTQTSLKRDGNFIPVYGGVGDSGEILPWSIDSITGRVLMEIHVTADNTPSTPVTRALHDANFRHTLTGASDVTGLPLSVAIDQTDNFMGVDVIFE